MPQISDEDKKLYEKLQSPKVETLGIQPQRYGPITPDSEGQWKVLWSDGVPVATAWTDWEDGFGFIPSGRAPQDLLIELETYHMTSRSLDIPAGWAYTILDSYVKRFESEITFSDPETGKLSSVINQEETPNEA